MFLHMSASVVLSGMAGDWEGAGLQVVLAKVLFDDTQPQYLCYFDVRKIMRGASYINVHAAISQEIDWLLFIDFALITRRPQGKEWPSYPN